MDEFTQGYLEAALWSSTDDDGTPMDRDHSVGDIEPQSLQAMEADCEKFQLENEGALQAYYDAGFDAAHAGHDFWLTRNHHGAGFWDRQYVPKSVGKELTDAAHHFGESDLYVGRDDRVHLEGVGEPYDPNQLDLTPSDEAMMQDMGIRAAKKATLLKKSFFGDVEPELEEEIMRWLKRRNGMTTGELEKEMGVVGGSQRVYAALMNLKKEGVIVQKRMRWYRTASLATKITGARRELQPWDWHSLNIALKTMKMPAAMQGVMGGPNEAEARRIIKRITGKEYEELPESMKRGRLPKSIPASLRKRTSMEKKALSRKDYIMIVGILRQQLLSHSGGGADAIVDVAEAFAAAFERENPRFNKQHFFDVLQGKKDVNSHPSRNVETADKEATGGVPVPTTPSQIPTAPLAAATPMKPTTARLAGIKLAVDPSWLDAAEELIEADDPLIYDVAADRGQIVGNVKHMSWFKQAVADWLQEDPEYYAEFQRETAEGRPHDVKYTS